MIDACWTNLRALLLSGDDGGYDKLLDFLAAKTAEALIARAERDRQVRGSLEYDGGNARELQARIHAAAARRVL